MEPVMLPAMVPEHVQLIPRLSIICNFEWKNRFLTLKSEKKYFFNCPVYKKNNLG